MRFVNPLYLIALAAVALPLLIHLLTRDRIRKVAFSTMRFFAKNSSRMLRRKKFQEAILLAIRMVIAGAVAFAFARPFFDDSASAAAAGTAATARVILVDVSQSMSRNGTPDAARAAIQKEASAALSSLSQGRDAAALVTFADTPTVDVGLVNQFDPIKEKIAAIQIGDGGTNIVEAIRSADALLRSIQAPHKEIVLISDLQRVGWRAIKSSWKLAPDTKIIIKPLPPPVEAGLAITDADYPQSLVLDGAPAKIAVRIANHSKQEVKDLPVTLTVGAKSAVTVKVNIAANGAAAARFNYVFEAAGDNPGVIRVGAGDKQTPQNVVYFNARAIPRIQVVIVNGAPSTLQAADAAFFLEKALAPSKESPFAVKTILATTAKADDFKDALVVVLANVGAMPESAISAVKDVLARGGGVMILPGDRVTPKNFEQFADIAPCRLRKNLIPEPVNGEPGSTAIAKVDYEHPIFDLFLRPHYGDFSTPKFYQWWEVGDSQLCRVLARFDDGRPAILERQINNAGISMLLASSVDLRWSDLPLRAIFLPYLHQTVRYLAIRTEKKTAFQVGQALAVPAGSQIKDPAGKLHDGQTFVPPSPGFYTLVTGSKPDFCYAVNIDPAEGDLKTISPEEIIAAVQRAQDSTDQMKVEVDAAKGDQDRLGLWWYVAMAMGAIFVFELFLGNRTLRH